ncbi:MAG TPA: hypothetical protein DHW82_14005 [Spirochaetia bacterium]|nr:MAG: hypothetical protein A2Y41_11960 [Spirochaetes bacterium GWB1_36_13]HCL58103.1 hypothetical protein [Spirochaetia bacterium]
MKRTMKRLFYLFLIFGFGLEAHADSFESIIGKTGGNLQQGTFRFGLGFEIKNSKWGNGDYSSLVVPFNLSLGLFQYLELDTGIKYNKPYSFVDNTAINNKVSYHDFYAGVKLLMNPETVLEKPAYGFWFGVYLPLHNYEVIKPVCSFLLSSAVKDLFSWNFNLGMGYYIGKIDYKDNPLVKSVSPGGEVNASMEVGYKMNDILKLSSGIDTKVHFWTKKEYLSGLEEELDGYQSWNWITALRLKPGDFPLVVDTGFKIGLNKKAEDSFSFFVQIQIIPDGANASW